MIALSFVRPNIAKALVSRLDIQCFPIDDPPEWHTARWFVGRDDGVVACYCAWRQDHGAGFLYRAGVAPSHRGRKLQRWMIRLREEAMRRADLKKVISYTDADNAASMRSLIAEGYLPYDPADGARLSGPPERMGRVGFVHWEKAL